MSLVPLSGLDVRIRAWLVGLGAGLGLLITALTVPGHAQVIAGPPPPPGRGGGPQTRQMPIGTAVISGTVTAADTGRAIRNAIVTVSGQSDVPISGRGSQAGAASRGAPPGSAAGRGAGDGGLGMVVTGGIGAGTSIVEQRATSGMFLSRSTTTDNEGRFVFEHLPSGRFTIGVSRSQFLSVNYGQRAYNRPGTTVALGAGQKLSLPIRMTRTSTMSGTVIGEDGEPHPNARVQVYRYAYANGFRRLQSANGALSDERGIYRIAGLQPGEYVVAATMNSNDLIQADRVNAEQRALQEAIAHASARGGSTSLPSIITLQIPNPGGGGPQPGFAPTFYPGTPTASAAATIVVEAGADRANIDIPVLPIRAGSIRGTVFLPPGMALGVQLMLVNTDPTAAAGSQGQRASPDGSFTIANVSPGTYLLRAYTVASPQMQPPAVVSGVGAAPRPVQQVQLQESERLWAEAVVTVDGMSTPNVALTLEPGRSISGVVVFETATPIDSSRARIVVTATPAPSSEPNTSSGPPPQALVGPDGRFTIQGVTPGRYILRASGQTKSAVVNGIDTLDFPLEITGERDITNATLTVSDRVSELTGRLTESNGQPASNYTIVFVADDSRFWTPASRRILIARPGTDGLYTFRGFPPGSYLLAAVTDLEPGSQYDPTFLKELASAAMRVTVGEGARQTQDIRVAQ